MGNARETFVQALVQGETNRNHFSQKKGSLDVALGAQSGGFIGCLRVMPKRKKSVSLAVVEMQGSIPNLFQRISEYSSVWESNATGWRRS